MDEKWEFVPTSEDDFRKQKADRQSSRQESLFSPDEFTFHDIGKTPDLFRTTEFDKHSADLDNSHFPPQSPTQNTEILSSPEHRSNMNDHQFNMFQYDNNPKPVQRTSSMPRSIERQTYKHYNYSPMHTAPVHHTNYTNQINYSQTQFQPNSPTYSNYPSNRNEFIHNNSPPTPYFQQQVRYQPNFSQQQQPVNYETQHNYQNRGQPIILRRSTDPTHNYHYSPTRYPESHY